MIFSDGFKFPTLFVSYMYACTYMEDVHVAMMNNDAVSKECKSLFPTMQGCGLSFGIVVVNERLLVLTTLGLNG